MASAKTSIAEAIEWLFYGVTKRRQQGDAYSRSEYAGSYANVHGGAVTKVEALIALNNRKIRLGRELRANESSVTFVDRVPASFGSLNIRVADAVHPVIAQHGLQAFIHSRPKDRRDAVCAALGLDELTEFKSALDSARTSFQRSAPSSVQAARRELTANVLVLAKIPATAALAARWQKTPMQVDPTADLGALLKGSAALTGVSATTAEKALEQLRSARQEASRAVFNVAPLEVPEDAADRLTLMRRKADELPDKVKAVSQAISAVIAAMTASFTTVLLEFWQTGLAQAPEGDICPMCEAPTLDVARRAELARRLSANQAVLIKGQALTTEAEAASKAIDQLQTLVDEFGVESIDEPEQAKLRKLLTDSPEVCDVFLKKHAELCAGRTKFNDAIRKVKSFIIGCSDQITDFDKASEISADAAAMQDAYAVPLSEFLDIAEKYVAIWHNFQQQLAAITPGSPPRSG